MTNGYTKSLPEVVNDLKAEFKDFVSTRVAMLRSEMSAKVSALKEAVPALLGGIVFLSAAGLLFTGFLVTAIALAFATPWGWAWAFLIVAAAYALLGGMLAVAGLAKLKQTKLVPERTLRVLKQDEVWLRTEAKTQI
jgi:MFS family permease